MKLGTQVNTRQQTERTAKSKTIQPSASSSPDRGTSGSTLVQLIQVSSFSFYTNTAIAHASMLVNFPVYVHYHVRLCELSAALSS